MQNLLGLENTKDTPKKFWKGSCFSYERFLGKMSQVNNKKDFRKVSQVNNKK